MSARVGGVVGALEAPLRQNAEKEGIRMTDADNGVMPENRPSCKWCADKGWFTSWNGGFAHVKPCEYCNSDGTAKRRPPEFGGIR